ncbi:unnamed protein product [Rhizophagus irregularis]|nr:unnamed protein product [Rhizophagus irregularis]CAB5294089.1 unnamed protein product [Rhizophagus irregularis]
MSESSAIAKRHFDSKCLDTKPDFTVMIMNLQKHIELFIVEIKLNKMNNTFISVFWKNDKGSWEEPM